MNLDRLLFRRQYVFGPENCIQFNDWTTERLPENKYVSAHPELKITKIESGNDCIVLLGYILDPENPENSDLEILRNLYAKKFNDVIRNAAYLAGRFVCITYLEGKYRIFNDTNGFRQIFYCKDSKNEMWCASQPSLISMHLGLNPDEQICQDLNRLPMFKSGKEYWYPGTLTSFKNIYHLLPNHFLDINKEKQERFWPNSPIEQISLEKCVDQSADLLQKLINAAVNRFEIEFALTSGLDSRILLAASRQIKNKIHYFTHTHRKLSISGFDIVIPSQISKEQGIDHNIVFHSDILNPDFERIFKKNIMNARIEKGLNAFAMFKYFEDIKKEKVVIHGNAGEITRAYFYLPPIIPLNGRSLAIIAGMEKSNIAINEYDSWLKGAIEAAKSGIRVLDLFYWEQRIANWAAMSYSEYDIAFESFTPFSSRQLLNVMLGASYKYRCAPEFILHKKIIDKLWPELLKYDINPSKTKIESVKKKLKRSFIHNTFKFFVFLRHYNQVGKETARVS